MLAAARFHDPLPLTNTVQRYDWGAVDAIPQLLGVEPDGDPQAELWLGAHGSAPSVTTVEGERVPLDRLITEAPVQALGHRVAEQFGPRLPFLLKVLAAGRALSLQVHPSPRQAREGFARENASGLALSDAKRSFKDDQHKPEMMVALTQFEGLAGFRSVRTILGLLEGLEGSLVSGVRQALARDRSSAGMHDAFHHLLSARSDTDCRSDIQYTVDGVRARLESGSPFTRADRTVIDLAEQHPGDPGAIASLMLNRVSLEPGEALFTPAGEVHAYLSGLGIEIMANSDNVLRAGLTTKLVDEENLVRCTSFAPRSPAVPEMTRAGSRGQVHTYRVPVSEFALTAADVDDDEPVSLPATGPRIALCLDGTVELTADRADHGPVTLRQGDSVFVPHDAGNLELSGSGHATCAWVP
ncbi:mannose-6-phosphate isomerase, class I [Myceligenerans indicum]|uniref:mannose-6-phosphate isomerase n=1 Tax=Myceligenerans indicum TaxID=2593663 RepID=A0ABS1LI11_9MICO|nr:mannose-6-phosphate isomerase, class I [Myceligenerans indicum]MBL0885865.1 mannose-6-phosphate isomerase, class I [Myceligenerans indicum]